ncbi:MAG TPA: hypothetical protein VF337_09080 [Candidatus Limnocylindrales bacterium]
MKTTRSMTAIGAGVMATVVLLAGCAGSSVSSGSQTSAGNSAGAQSSAAVASGAQLVVLADGSEGIAGLWMLDDKLAWTQLSATPGATALGVAADGIALATGHTVEIRPRTGLGKGGAAKTLNWVGAIPTAPIVAIDTSGGDKMVLVTADTQSLGYAIVTPDGSAAALSPAPSQAFTPSAAWLDDSRLLVLSTDNSQVSRLAVVDTATQTLKAGTAVSGVRVMGLSGDRQVVCVATEAAVSIGSVDSLLGSGPITPTIGLASDQVVWGLTLDARGSHLYMFSGTPAADGQVGAGREVVYAKLGSEWVRVLDSAVLFGRPIGQVLLG